MYGWINSHMGDRDVNSRPCQWMTTCVIDHCAICIPMCDDTPLSFLLHCHYNSHFSISFHFSSTSPNFCLHIWKFELFMLDIRWFCQIYDWWFIDSGLSVCVLCLFLMVSIIGLLPAVWLSHILWFGSLFNDFSWYTLLDPWCHMKEILNASNLSAVTDWSRLEKSPTVRIYGCWDWSLANLKIPLRGHLLRPPVNLGEGESEFCW